jgi:hypothetical protein
MSILISRVFLTAAALEMGCLFALGQPSSSSVPPTSLYAVARNELLDRALYIKPDRIVSHVASSGAVSVNGEWEHGRQKQFFIEQQRYGADLVQAGVMRKNQTLVEEGWRILAWGLARQGPDGGFPGTGDPFHSTSMFVEGAARALLLQRQSGSESAEEFVARYQPRVIAAAQWLMRPAVAEQGKKHNQPYTHRRWILAAALGQAAALNGDRRMAQAAAEYAREGLALQRPDGINPEKGGSDSSYQGFGILLAERYYLVCPDPALRAEIRNMIERGLHWELTRVDGSGSVSTTGNSRVGKESGRSGAAKTVDYKSLLQAFTFGAALTGNQRYEKVAERIALGQKWLRP